MKVNELGKFGEDMAAKYLELQGYCIQCRNFRCRAGEIDLVASKGGTLHFIEVKTRRGDLFGTPEESVTKMKQAHMRQAVQRYLSLIPESGRSRKPQMDVIAIRIDHIEVI